MSEPMADLRHYLRLVREALLWKLDGLSEYDARRPLTATGTNLLGLVKHMAGVEAGYLADSFGRPMPDPPAWFDGDEPNADMWAGVGETRTGIVEVYRRVHEHCDATLDALALDAAGHVSWWPPDRADVTLHLVLVHLIAEYNRHAGHADIVRELIDGEVGLRQERSNLPDVDPQWWTGHRDRVEQAASAAGTDPA